MKDPASANNGDVPEAALEDAIAWRAANGGLSWRTDRPHKFDVRPFKLGEALLERRGDDPAAIATVLYLGHRLRAESPNFIGVMTGVTLAQKVMEKRPPGSPEYAAWAPTEGELLEMIVMSKLHERLEDMYKTIDAYHAWQRALPKP